MKDQKFWDLIQSFNELMKDSIKGPDCTDPSICQGNCCGIQIDVPKILAEKYIDLGYATKHDFIRSNIFSFKLRFDNEKAKCFLFNTKQNGCSVHHSGIKPPQCWIYPTKFDNKTKNISCKMVDGWRICNFENTARAKRLLDKYNSYCIDEAKNEIRKIEDRIENSVKSNSKKNIIKELRQYRPSEIGGYQDSWDCIHVLPAEGYSLKLKKFCKKFNNECEFLPDNFFECDHVCKEIANSLTQFFKNHFSQLIENHGIDPNGKYPFHRLFDFL